MMAFSVDGKTMTIVVLCGGVGSEREVSLRSGKGCAAAVERLGHDCLLLDLQGRDDVLRLIDAKPEVVLIALHGEKGEDGTVQGLLEWLGLDYTGSGVLASALCMDKLASKEVFRKAGLPVAPAISDLKSTDFSSLCGEWKCEKLFFKERTGGSSVGACIVGTPEEYMALPRRENRYMIEPFLPGRELTFSLLQEGKDWICLPALELKPKGPFYDYESKYTVGGTEFLLPAPLTREEYLELSDLAKRSLKAAGCEGYARVDMILTDRGPAILEINTLPGMTETSDMPAQAKAAGIDYDQLVERILLSAKAKKKS